MSRESYALEKFSIAVDALATGSTSIQDRLHTAFMSFHPVQKGDFADTEDRSLYARIMDRLTSVRNGDPEKGYVLNTLGAMDDETARAIAEDIVSLYKRLQRRTALR